MLLEQCKRHQSTVPSGGNDLGVCKSDSCLIKSIQKHGCALERYTIVLLLLFVAVFSVLRHGGDDDVTSRSATATTEDVGGNDRNDL